MTSEVVFSHFFAHGYVLVPGVISEVMLKRLREEASNLVEEARAGLVSETRIYDDLPHFLGGRNVAGIEDPLVLLPELKRWIEGEDLIAQVQAITKRQDLNIDFARLHCNSRIKYRGFWHRDGDVDEGSVVAVLYLRDEKGFRLLPKGLSPSQRSDSTSRGRHLFGEVPGQVVCEASAGDLLLFQAELWHRGHSTSPRLHLHVKLTPAAPGRSIGESSASRSGRLSAAPTNQSFLGAAKGSVGRGLRLVRYLLPGTNHSSVFQRD